jgi:mono/diheme cytochrome c family protein
MHVLNRPRSTRCSALFAMLLLTCTQTLQAQSASAEERGKQHMVTYFCASCHGFTGQGGQTDIAPKINVDVLTADALVAYVRNPGGDMPPYRTEAQIPDQALRDIYAYLKSVPASPAWEDIPLLKD